MRPTRKLAIFQSLFAERTILRDANAPSGAEQLEAWNLDVEGGAVLVDHPIASAHRAARCVERATRDVIEARSRRDQWHFTDHTLAHHFVYGSAAINDRPAARQELDSDLRTVLDPHVV